MIGIHFGNNNLIILRYETMDTKEILYFLSMWGKIVFSPLKYALYLIEYGY